MVQRMLGNGLQTGYSTASSLFTCTAHDPRRAMEEVLVSCHHQVHLEATAEEVDAAQAALISALDASWDDETATERIIVALNRLRAAQARQTAARSGLTHLPDLVGWG